MSVSWYTSDPSNYNSPILGKYSVGQSITKLRSIYIIMFDLHWLQGHCGGRIALAWVSSVQWDIPITNHPSDLTKVALLTVEIRAICGSFRIPEYCRRCTVAIMLSISRLATMLLLRMLASPRLPTPVDPNKVTSARKSD